MLSFSKKNYTTKCLFPCLTLHGDYLFYYLYNLSIENIYLGDFYYKKQIPKRVLFVAIEIKPRFINNNKVYRRILTDFRDWCKYQEFYVDSYNSTINDVKCAVFILKVPDACNNSYDNFILSDFKNIYNDKQYEMLHCNPILTRQKNIDTFKKELNELSKSAEIDKHKEMLNYNLNR